MSCILQWDEFGLQQSPSRPILSHRMLSSSRLVELLQSAAKSEKKDKKLPSVGLALLEVSLKEGAFELFWKEAVENGLFKEKSGPVRFVLTYTLFFNLLFFCFLLLFLVSFWSCGRMELTVSYKQHENI